MADLTIKDVRAKFPQYSDLTDTQLADALHGKYYSDVPKDQFYGKIGLTGAEAASRQETAGFGSKDQPLAPIEAPQLPWQQPVAGAPTSAPDARPVMPPLPGQPQAPVSNPDQALIEAMTSTPPPPVRPRSADPLPTFGMMGGTSRDQGDWAKREVQRLEQEMTPEERAAAAKPTQPAGFTPKPETYTPLGEAILTELGNTPERLQRGFKGNTLLEAERGIHVNLTDIGAIKRGSSELADVEAQLATMKAEMDANPRKAPGMQAPYLELATRRDQLRNLYPDAAAQIDSERAALATDQGNRSEAQTGIDALTKAMNPTNAAPGLNEALVSGIASFGDMAPGMVSSLITRNPLPMLAYLGAYSRGSTYADKRQEGYTPEKARSVASLYAMAETIPEILPLGIILKDGGSALLKIGGGAATEAASEVLTQGLQQMVDIGLLKEDMTWGQAIEEMQKAGAAGGVMGALMGAGGVTADQIGRLREDKRGTPADPRAVPPAVPSAAPAAMPSPAVDPLAAAMLPAQDVAPTMPPVPANLPTPSGEPAGGGITSSPPVAPNLPTPQAGTDPGDFEIMDETETVNGETRLTGRKVRVNLKTGQASVVEANEAAAVETPPVASAPATPPVNQPQAPDAGAGAGSIPPAVDSAPAVEGSKAPESEPQADLLPADAPQAAMPKPQQAVEVLTERDIANIETDAKTFQYKDGGDDQGVTDRLRGVKSWEPERAGMSLVYEYADGRRVIADGHQRLGLAKRLAAEGQPIQMPVRVLREVDGISPAEARMRAALKNIAEGTGTAIDAAKVLRHTGQTPAQLNLPPNSAIVRDASGLQRLSDEAFGMVVNGVSTEQHGGIVGRLVEARDAQAGILALLNKLKPRNAFEAESITRQAAAETTTETQDSLFGTEQITANLYLERARVLDGALRRLKDDIKTFRTLTERAEAIASVGNQLVTEENQSRLDQDAKVRDYLASQANMKGPISEALSAAARDYKDTGKIGPAVGRFVDAVRRASETGSAGSDGGRAGGQAPEPAGGAKPPAESPQAEVKPAPAAQPEPDPAPAGDDLFNAMLPQQSGKSPEQIRAEAEAKVRADQSKMRKPGGNSGDAGPLFDDQPDLLDQKPAAPQEPSLSPADEVMRRRAIETADSYRQPNDDPRTAFTDLLNDMDSVGPLMADLAAASGLEARARIADAWVRKRGKAAGVEYLVALDKDGQPLAVGRGTKSNLSFTPHFQRMAADGRIAYATHNHPSSRGFSVQDITVALSFGVRVVAVGHNGNRHEMTAPLGAGSTSWEVGKGNPQLLQALTDAEKSLASAIQARIDAMSADPVAANKLVDRLNQEFHNVMSVIWHDLGIIAYNGDATASVARFIEDYNDLQTIIDTATERAAARIGRAGFDVAAPGNRGADRAPAEGTAKQGDPNGNRAPDGPAGRGERDGRVPEDQDPVTDDFDGALDDIYGTPEPQTVAPDQPFDAESWQKERDDRIAASKASGVKHLDQLDASVEGMRGIAFHNVHDPKERGIVRTVSNTGDVVVNWHDAYSAEKNLVSETTKDGKKQVWQSWLSPSDLKDYAVDAATRPAAKPARSTSDIAKDLGNLFSEPRAGFREDGFDQTRYARAIPLFTEALDGIDVAALSQREVFAAMIRPLAAAGLPREAVAKMRPYFERFLADRERGMLPTQEDGDVSGPGGDLERDRGDTDPGDTMGGTDVPAAGGRSGGRSGSRGTASGGRGGRRSGGERLPGGDAAPVGTESDQDIQGDGRAGQQSADGGDRAAGGDRGEQGLPPDEAPASHAGGTARDGTQVRDRAALQRAADERAKRGIKPADEADIRASLPLLLPEQQDDVLKVERRFQKPDGHGMMITNGTGTGKTYSGGGVIKRFAQAGKTNILIVAPSQGILDHWVAAGADLGLTISKLDDTSTAGTGIVATTYANLGANGILASRDWDMVVTDESHSLSRNQAGDMTAALRNLRAITNRPADLWHKFHLQQADRWARIEALKDGSPERAAAITKFYEDRAAFIEAEGKKPRGKVLFLSATPFAYDVNTDYAEGYLFNYPADGHVGNSRQSGRNLFMVENFGYRIRYHKLTKPEAAVDSGVFERQFHEKLKREGVLSGRHLDIEPDYERRFVQTEDAEGAKIDGIFDFIREKSRERTPEGQSYARLLRFVERKFNYLKRMQLLEAIKARSAQATIDRHLALGRKIVIFHDYNQGGGFNPFRPNQGDGTAAMLAPESEAGQDEMFAQAGQEGYDLLVQARPEVEALNFAGYLPPVQELTKRYGARAAVYNGTVSNKDRAKAKTDFNKDGSGVDIIIVQSAAGEAGISLHDLSGDHHRVLINLGMPTRPTTALQEEGRIRREGSVSNAIFQYMTIGTTWERQAFAAKIAERSGAVENLALGNEARAIRESFIDAYNDAAPWTPGDTDGTGGKMKDRRRALVSPYDEAKTHYFGRTRTSGRRDQRDGLDFYPTPEPLAFKMVEWAGIRPYERALEPSAGDGSIARYLPDHADRTIIEPSADLLSRAQLRAVGARPVQSTFEDFHIVNKFNAIVMNPPFGSGGKTAIEHLAKAARHLKPGGRIVALIPTGPAADKRFDAWHYSDESKGLWLAADITLPAVTFERAGTTVLSRVVIFDKIDPEAREDLDTSRRINMSGAQTIAEFFDRLEGIEAPTRPAQTVDPIEDAEAAPAAPERPAAPVTDVGFKLDQTVHSKTGADLFVATADARTDDDTYKAMLAVAKAHGGWYSKWRGPGAIPGFQFKSEAQRAAFIEDMQKPTLGMAEPAYHGSPHEFDRFSLEHIGRGEGAQVYGWGLYFAGRREVAEYYKRTLARTDLTLNGAEIPQWLTSDLSAEFHTQMTGLLADEPAARPQEVSEDEWRKAKPLLPYAVKNTLTNLRDKVRYDGDDPVSRLGVYRSTALAQFKGSVERNENPYEYIAKLGAIDWLEQRVGRTRPARLYKVEVPEVSEMLDYDASLDDQPQAVQTVLRDLLPDMFGADGESVWTEQPETDMTRRAWVDQFGWQIVEQDGGFFSVISPSSKAAGGRNIADKRKLSDAKKTAEVARKHYAADLTGHDAYNMLSVQRGGDQAASEALRAAGIPGHRYLDGMSRDSGDGSRNYVIYDDSRIEITGFEEPDSPMFQAGTEADTSELVRRAMPALRAELDRLDLKRVRLDRAMGVDWQGAFEAGDDMRIIIGASLDPMATLRHEVIHALRAMDLFTPAEWKALTLKAAQDWMTRYDIAARYPTLDTAAQIEEAIAEAYGDAIASKKAPEGSILIAAFNKIARLLRAVRNVLNGAGLQTYEDVFGRVQSGAVSGRQQDQGLAQPERRFQAADLAGAVDKLASDLKAEFQLRDLSMFLSRGNLKLNMIAVSRTNQGKGTGTQVMSRIVAFADANGLRTILSPGLPDDGFGTTSRSRLVQFYKRFGFVENKGRNKDFTISEGMYRAPQQGLAAPMRKFQAARLPSRQARAHMATTMQGAAYIPDRRIWEELSRAGAPAWQRIRMGAAAAHDLVDRARIQIQDRFLPVLRAQQAVEAQAGQPLDADHNAYVAETTFSGKVGRHLYEIDEDYTKPIISIIAATKGGLTSEAVGQWLYARHAQERNAHIASINPKMPDGGSGMSNAEAAQILADAAASPHAADLADIARLIDALRERTIQLRQDAGLITPTEAGMWRNQYRFYVPLKGFAETDHSEAVLDMTGTGRRFNTKGAETQRALGRRSEAFNPLQAAITQAQEASIRAEKNRVGGTVYNLAKDYPSPALWSVKTVRTKRYYNRTTGLVETRPVDPISLFMDPNEMAVKIGGVEHRVIFHDPRLARALGNVGADQMNWFVRLMSGISRWFSMTRTMLNPEFVISNAFRDMTTAQVNIHAFGKGERGDIAKAMIRNWPKALAGAWRGQANKADTTWSKHYKEFEQAGAKVSFWTLENPEAGSRDFDRRIWLASGPRAMRILKATVSPSAFFSTRDNGVLHFIERTNMAVDNAIRLAAFVEARQRGWPVHEAAALAKNLTVNFNRRGEASPTINALYTFFNAAVQGSTNIVAALATSRRVQMIAIGLVAAGFLNDISNAYLSDEDDDEVLAYDKIPDWQSQRALHFMLGKDSGTAAAIPLPYGWNVFPYVGQQLGKISRGVKEPGEAMADTAAAIFGAFSPVNGGDFVALVTPTAGDPLLEMARNMDWRGRPIRPEYPGDDKKPDSQKYFGGASEAAKWVAEAANSITGGTSAISGAVDVSPEYIDHAFAFVVGSAGSTFGRSVDLVAKAATGKTQDVTMNDVPFARVVVKDTYPGLDRDRYFTFRQKVEAADYAVRQSKTTGEAVPAETRSWASLGPALKQAEKMRRAGQDPYLKFNALVTRKIGVLAE